MMTSKINKIKVRRQENIWEQIVKKALECNMRSEEYIEFIQFAKEKIEETNQAAFQAVDYLEAFYSREGREGV
ncbi:hypothetical protein [Halalkalibacter akibai]|uniref:Uncharacterized protein n=1 Tax=Halalkalibacter akibai (strain ATCC 43226 / DSM 21942 / CIP 109018 / JCM 9157 / 1139) TaxID=1236973 RepID=W4QYZ0_HALA3|nr:hypothetical protein [Halalkalibacter akibai]GAE37291.1 hypothetical protein JCM9157_4565 [Halalkalibacter akibai JCM 9157]